MYGGFLLSTFLSASSVVFLIIVILTEVRQNLNIVFIYISLIDFFIFMVVCSSSFFNSLVLFLCALVFACVYVYVAVSESLNLDLQIVESCHMVLEIEPRSLKDHPMLLHTGPSLQPSEAHLL